MLCSVNVPAALNTMFVLNRSYTPYVLTPIMNNSCSSLNSVSCVGFMFVYWYVLYLIGVVYYVSRVSLTKDLICLIYYSLMLLVLTDSWCIGSSCHCTI